MAKSSFFDGLLQYLTNKFCENFFSQNPFLAILRLKKKKKQKVPMATKLKGGGG